MLNSYDGRYNNYLYISLASQIDTFKRKYPNSKFKVYLFKDNRTNNVLALYLPFLQ